MPLLKKSNGFCLDDDSIFEKAYSILRTNGDPYFENMILRSKSPPYIYFES